VKVLPGPLAIAAFPPIARKFVSNQSNVPTFIAPSGPPPSKSIMTALAGAAVPIANATLAAISSFFMIVLVFSG
jgi:hypothetical protein